MSRPTRPDRVDEYRFWGNAPDVPSPRLCYWLDRIADGWTRNRRIASLGYAEASRFFGVYIWEWSNVLWPIFDGSHSIVWSRPSTVRDWMERHDLRTDLLPGPLVHLPAPPGEPGYVTVREDEVDTYRAAPAWRTTYTGWLSDERPLNEGVPS